MPSTGNLASMDLLARCAGAETTPVAAASCSRGPELVPAGPPALESGPWRRRSQRKLAARSHVCRLYL